MFSKGLSKRSDSQFLHDLGPWRFMNPNIPILAGLDLFCRPEIEGRPTSCLNLSGMVITADLGSGAASSSGFGGALS